ncbi:MAG TPA: RNA-binding S4 domain-containing protein [Anaerovoracaceae bacterium]|nr:RNA-binding S4 domain-containing protein [Anaerovoracaceae bacterium]
MRIDKFLKNSRLIKRRTIAKEACEQGRILINDRVAKPGSNVDIGDAVIIEFATKKIKIRVNSTPDHVTKEMADSMYEIIDGSL